MKQEAGNVAEPLCKYRPLSFRYGKEIKAFIYTSKIFDFKNEKNEKHLHKLCMSRLLFGRKFHFFFTNTFVFISPRKNGTHVE